MLVSRSAAFTSLLGDKLLFYSMTGRETLGRLFSYEVDLLSEDESLDLSELLGQPATVVLERTDGSVREFNGFVTHFALVGQHGNFVRYRATLKPWLWFLSQTRNCRIFQSQTVPDVVKTIFRDHGFSDFEESFSNEAYRTWEYLVQYRESDLNFVSRILEQEGIHYFFKHEDGKHILVLADSNNAHAPNVGYERVPYFPPLGRERRQEEHLDAFTTARQIRPGKFMARDWKFKTPEILKANVGSPLESAHAEYELYDYPGDFTNQDEADLQVRLRLEEHQVEFETVQGGGPVRGLTAGCRFAMTQFPRDDQNREYIVLSASYEIRVSEYESNSPEDREPIFRFQFTAIDAKHPYRVPRLTRKPIVEGPQTATIVGPDKADIYTDEWGRVKVKFHWDRKEESNQDSSCWIRVSQVWAGQNWGAMHIPRLGQEVIVDFLEGDPDRPIITGRVYNQQQFPPYALPDNATQSGIKSRSTAGSSDGGATDSNFNELRFEDKKGSEEVYMQAEKDMTTLIKHDRTTTIQRNDTLNITGDQFIKIHGNLSMIVEGVTEKTNPDKAKPVKSSLGVTGAHRIDASDTIDIQAPNKITLTCGGSTITMTPDRIVLHAGGGTEIALDANGRFESSQHSKLFLDANAFLTSSGKATMLMDANVCTRSSAGDQVLMDGSVKISSPGDVSMSGINVSSSGSATAGIGAGNSSVVASTASVDVGAPAVNVNGQGPVNIGGAMVKIG